MSRASIPANNKIIIHVCGMTQIYYLFDNYYVISKLFLQKNFLMENSVEKVL